MDLFGSKEGSFHSTSRFNEKLILRPRAGHDGATPSANAVASLALARLSVHFDRGSLRDAAAKAIRAYGVAIDRQPRAFPTSLLALDFLSKGPVELAVIGDPLDPRTQVLNAAISSRFLPHRVIARGEGSRTTAPPPR